MNETKILQHNHEAKNNVAKCFPIPNSQASLQKTAETFGGIDIMCNNAGIMNEAAWEKMVSINLVRKL